jgi:chemotaxis protein methyltransferase WspC
MKPIEDLLRQIIGLNATAIGPTQIEQAVHARMTHHGLSQPEDYVTLLLQASCGEWNALIEEIVVTETWFFRDRESFRILAGLVEREWLPAHPNARLRILCVPCSTGEEPFSIAMSLLDAKVPAARFQIDAIDIRPAAITHAQRAQFGKNSFRGRELDFRDRYFKATDLGFFLNATVRKQVRFQTGNLIKHDCVREIGVYDFIFCRNLLMYLDRAMQTEVLRKLKHSLTDTGTLFVGSAEMPIASRNGFASAHLPLSFACRKTSAQKNFAQPGAANQITQAAKSAVHISPWSPPISQAPHAPADLEVARRLADEGRLSEAAAICETYLREHGASAEAYYLLGLAQARTGAETQATEFYRKALYLEPDHYETLQQWTLLSEKNGDTAQARLLSRRAKKVRPQN